MKILTFIGCNGKEIPVANCTRWRADACEARCTVFGKVSQQQCDSCRIRSPIMRLRRNGIRGLGDLVHLAIKAAFLGRIDIAERLAQRIGLIFGTVKKGSAQPAQPSSAEKQGGGCGCSARRERLNALLPFGK